jgi:hypothetical protein
MKYIAFEGTYNEQIYDSETQTITFVKPTIVVYDVTILVGNGTWKKYNEKDNSDRN